MHDLPVRHLINPSPPVPPAPSPVPSPPSGGKGYGEEGILVAPCRSHGARSNIVTLSIPKGEKNGEDKADLHTGGVPLLDYFTGRPWRTVAARDYYPYKTALGSEVTTALDRTPVESRHPPKGSN